MDEKFQKPADAQVPKQNGSGPVVRSMPKEYRFGSVAAPQRPAAKQFEQPVQVQVPQPKPQSKPVSESVPVKAVALEPKQKPHLPVIILGLGVVLILAASAIAYLVLKQTQPVAKPIVTTPPSTAPSVITPTPSTPPPAPAPVPEKKEGGVDSDSDGLTDVEELRLYGTLVFNPDTDNDSFLDGNEIFHLYDPTKENFARIADSALVRLHANAERGYALFVPASFVAAVSSDGSEVSFGIPSGENMTLHAYQKTDSSSLQAWFSAQFPGRTSDLLMPFTTKSGISGLQSAERLETFLDGENGFVYSVKYAIGPAKAIEYRQTYVMMLNSFVVENKE